MAGPSPQSVAYLWQKKKKKKKRRAVGGHANKKKRQSRSPFAVVGRDTGEGENPDTRGETLRKGPQPKKRYGHTAMDRSIFFELMREPSERLDVIK